MDNPDLMRKLALLSLMDVEIFITKNVQCYGCGNPETEILISKSQMVSLKCVACGVVSDVDMRDKKGMKRAEKE